METASQPKKHSRIYGYLAALAGMLVSFIAGILVGLHPQLLPDLGWAWHPNVDQPAVQTPSVPTTQPASTTAPSQTPPQGN